MKRVKKTHILVCLALILAFNSCDFGTSEYYTYTANDGYNEAYILWDDSGKCGGIIYDTTTKFDGIKLTFPSDNSVIQGYCESYYAPIRNEQDELVDSVETCDWYFDLSEKDHRIEKNSFTILHLLKGNKIVIVDTLFRKKTKITLLDKIPLPKLH